MTVWRVLLAIVIGQGVGFAAVRLALWLIPKPRRKTDVQHRQAQENPGDPGTSPDPVSPGSSVHIPDPAYPNFPNAPSTSGGTLHTSTGLEIPTEERDEAVKGWKRAGIRFVDGRYYFVPLNYGAEHYGATAVALCAGGYPATALSPMGSLEIHSYGPKLNCTCGFYAYIDRHDTEPDNKAQLALLEVDLYGTVIEHERGYRASNQSVLSAKITRRCYYCSNDDGLLLEIQTHGTVLPMCPEHRTAPIAVTPEDIGSIMETVVRWA